MPQALAAAIVTAIGVTGVTATILTAVLTLAIAAGLTVLTASIFGPKQPKPSDGQIITREGVGSRTRQYGICHTGGKLSFLESRNGTLAMVVTLGTGYQPDILEHRINDKQVTVVAGTITEASFHGAVHIYTRQGADDQTAIGELTAQFPEWTEDHRQRGCVHAAIICDPVKQKYFAEVYNSQQPAYTQVRKCVRLYDPRKDDTAIIGHDEAGAPIMGDGDHRLADPATWEWSDNGALVTADYAAHSDGYGLGYDNVNWTNIAQEADVCDQEQVTVTEETIARWRLWASYSLANEERRQVMANMLKAIDGFCWQGPDFKFNLKVGRFEAPTITLTDDHILSMTATLGPGAQQRVSSLKMLYTEAEIGYREQESATVDVPGEEADANTDPQSVEIYYAPHHNQAVRVGKLLAARLGSRWHLELVLNLYGLNLFGERFAHVTSAALGIDADFAIEAGLKLNISEGEITIGVKLIEVRAADWEFDAATEEGTPPLAPDSGGGDPIVIPVPTGLTLSAVQIALGETYGVAIEASWDAPSRADLVFQVQYRPSAGGTWVQMTVDNDAYTARSGPVNSGIEYEVQIRALTISYRTSEWSLSETITPVSDTALGAPTGLAADDGTGESQIGRAHV